MLPGPTGRYSIAQLKALTGYVRRQNPAAAGQVSIVSEIRTLLRATGVAHDGSEYSKAFREAVAERPDHRTLAKLFKNIRNAPDVLECPDFSNRAVSQIAQQLRGRWKHLPDGSQILKKLNKKDASEFTDKDLRDVRDAAERLEVFHSNLARNHTSRRNDLDTLLIGLADIFAIAAGYRWSRFTLGTAERSRFIGFVHVTLTPFLPKREVSINALYLRWRRLQKEERPLGRPKTFSPHLGRKPLSRKRKLNPRI